MVDSGLAPEPTNNEEKETHYEIVKNILDEKAVLVPDVELLLVQAKKVFI